MQSRHPDPVTIPEQWSGVELQVAATVVPKLVIMGCCDTGKSHLFETLSEHSPLPGTRFAYWDMLSSPGARVRAGFWSTLSSALGASGVTDPVQLKRFLSSADLPSRLLLVLDHWDDAREDAIDFVDLAALQELSDFVTRQPSTHVPGLARLGLIVVTRFPTTGQFVQYAHRTRRPGFKRLSGDLERYYKPMTFPFLSYQGASGLARDTGVPAPLVDEVVRLCGGWPGLLLALSRRVATSQCLGDDELVGTALEDLPLLLGKTTLPLAAASAGWGASRSGLEALAEDYTDNPGSTLRRYALPPSFDDPLALPGLLHQYLVTKGRF